jgi:anti-sigma B factor antagonist
LENVMQGIWTEELAPVVVADGASTQRLLARIVVTGIGAAPAHADVGLSGELCAGTTPAVAEAVDGLLSLGVTDVRFDLSALRLCTSAGIDLWVDLSARLTPSGGDLRLDGAAGVVRRALDAVGVSDSGTVHPPHGH